MSYYRQQLEDWLKTIDVKSDKVLDIGGSALPVKTRVKSWKVEQDYILDNENELNFNHKNWEYPHFPFDILDWDNIKEIKFKYKHEFDVIFCLEVFEYIIDPLQALKNIHFLLKEGGTLYITFPFVYPLHEPVNKDYMRYTEYGVYALLEKAGFNMDSIMPKKRVDRSKLLQEFYHADGMHPAKAHDHSVTGFLVSITK